MKYTFVNYAFVNYAFGLIFLAVAGVLSWIQLDIFVSPVRPDKPLIGIMTILTILSYLGSYMIYGGSSNLKLAIFPGTASLLQTLGLFIAIAIIAIDPGLHARMRFVEYFLLVSYIIGFGIFGIAGVWERKRA